VSGGAPPLTHQPPCVSHVSSSAFVCLSDPVILLEPVVISSVGAVSEVKTAVLEVPEEAAEAAIFRVPLVAQWPGAPATRLSALVDTGAALCLLRRSSVPARCLRPAARPRRFVSASGAAIAGGDEGVFLSCRIGDAPPMRIWFYVCDIVEQAILSLALLTRMGAVLYAAPRPCLAFPGGSTARALPVGSVCSVVSSVPYSVVRSVFVQFNRWCESKGMGSVTVDAFANAQNAQVKRFWSVEDSAFSHSWRGEVLWCNPPFEVLTRVLAKWRVDGAYGLLCVPVWRGADWWSALLGYEAAGAVRGHWLLPRTCRLYQRDSGVVLPPPAWQSLLVFIDCRRHVRFGAVTVKEFSEEFSEEFSAEFSEEPANVGSPRRGSSSKHDPPYNGETGPSGIQMGRRRERTGHQWPTFPSSRRRSSPRTWR
jgi:hypothetical protein